MENIILILILFLIFTYIYINSTRDNIVIHNKIHNKIHKNHEEKQIVQDVLKNIYYKPVLIPKDTMNSDPGNKNYYKVSECNLPNKAWSDKSNVNNPIFYKSDFNTNMLGMKHFYDINNKYHSKPIDNKLKTTRKFMLLV